MFDRKCRGKLALLGRIAEAVGASDELATVTRLIVELSVEFLAAQRGSLMLSDGHRELSIIASVGMDREAARAWRGRLAQGVAGTVAAQGTPLFCTDVLADGRFPEGCREPVPARSFISTPIVGRDRLLGVLNFYDPLATPFDDDDLDLVGAVAALAALAMEKLLLARNYQDRTADIEEANRRLIAQDLAKTEFLTRLSHELRTPLNAIQGSMHLLRDERVSDAARRGEFLDIVATETERLLDMVNRQLDFLRIEDESRMLRKTFLALDAILREVLRTAPGQKSARYRQLEVELDLPPSLEEVIGDKILVGQMFVHLLDGLAAYLTKSTRLRITIREKEAVGVILQAFEEVPETVQDGLLAVKNIYRSDRPEESVKFYLAMKVAENHGWRLGIGNSDEGFRVSLHIPRAQAMRRDTALAMVMDRALGFVSEVLGVDTCSLMLSDELTGELTIRSALGLDDWIVQQTRIRPGDRIAGWVAQEGQPVLIENIETDVRFARKNLKGQYRSNSLLSLPLLHQGQAVGVLNLNNKKNGEPFTERDLALAAPICERLSLLLEKTSHSCEHEGELRDLVAGLDALLTAEQRYRKKSSRYAELLVKVLEELGAGSREKALAPYVALVYDLGLIAHDEHLATRKRPLTPVESLVIRNHPQATLDMLESIESSQLVAKAVLHHHERFDGQGYPDGLKGDEIPLMARALAIVDAYCAMTEDRPYRAARGSDEALRELEAGAGTLYDPLVVEALQAALAG